MSGATTHVLAVPAIVSIESARNSHVVDVSRYAAVQFEATVKGGPHAGASLNGILMIQDKGAHGKIVGSLTQQGPIGGGFPDLDTIPVTGSLHGKNLSLKFDLGDGVSFSGTGKVTIGKDGTKHVTLKGTGTLTGSTAGDTGDWSLVDLNQPFTFFIKIRNTTKGTLNYSFGFLGTSSYRNYSTPAGYSTTFSFKGTLGSHLAPQIKFDASYAAGAQYASFSMTAGNSFTTSGSVGTGVYYFTSSGQNIYFYKT